MSGLRIIHLREMEGGEALDLIEGASKGWVPADAAIDLYDSLKALLDALDENGSCQYEALRELGRDALAKSRGEQ